MRTLSLNRADSPASPRFAPLRSLELEIGSKLPRIAKADESGTPHQAALCLVRLHGTPLGSMRIELPDDELDPADLAQQVQARLGGEIARHLRRDGIDPDRALGPDGLGGPDPPPCARDREDLLARAPRVSVVIPTRNRPASALATVRSVLRSRYPEDRYEVILVDNASRGDAEVSLPGDLEKSRTPVKLVREPAPGGSNARNAGLRAAGGEIVAFADDDVAVDEGWLLSLAGAFERGERVAGAAGITMPRELETPAQLWFEGLAGGRRGFDPIVFDPDHPPAGRPLFPFTVGDLGSGENMAFRRDALIAAGGFDPALGSATPALGGEDVEAMLRVLLAGHQVVYEPGAVVWHAHPREYQQLRQRARGYGVGLTATLTKTVVQHPRLLPDLARKLPAGLAYALSSKSAKNLDKAIDYPPELTRLELRGMTRGPWAYARGRREAKRARRGAAPTGKKSLRVLLVTDSYPMRVGGEALIGGATFWSQQVAQQMSERGHTVEVATTWQPGAPAREADGAVEVHRLRDLTSRVPGISADPYKHNPPSFPDPEAVLRLRRRIRKFKPDLVHSYGWLTHSVAAALVGTEVPLLISTQDYGNICALRTLFRHGEICEGSAPAKCLECAGSNYGTVKGAVAVAGIFGSRPLIRRKATRIHSISRYVANAIERDLNPPAPIEIVPNFGEDVSAKAVDEEILAQLPEQPFILFVGALRQVKGIDELCAAYQRLENPPPLILAGPLAPDTPEQFPEGVTVFTSVPHPTVMAMWDRALFGVFPSKWPEPLGNVVYEAMSRGRAVIGTRPGGHEDMVSDGETGLLVGAGDVEELTAAMSRLIGDAGLREALGERARERSRAFTAGAVLPELERLYEETAGVWAGEPRPKART